MPVFVDGTGIEVDGRLFEHAARLHAGERGYWLHGIFVGGLWVNGRLRPGGDVACGWKRQMKRDLAPLLVPGTPVWVHCDSAYYRGEFVEYLSAHGWDYSVSVTDANKCRPVLDMVENLPERGWTDIGMGESATWVRYRPAKWKDEQSYVVVRRAAERQGELLPRFTVVLANRDDLPLAEVVRRHRSKQGFSPSTIPDFPRSFKRSLNYHNSLFNNEKKRILVLKSFATFSQNPANRMGKQ